MHSVTWATGLGWIITDFRPLLMAIKRFYGGVNIYNVWLCEQRLKRGKLHFGHPAIPLGHTFTPLYLLKRSAYRIFAYQPLKSKHLWQNTVMLDR